METSTEADGRLTRAIIPALDAFVLNPAPVETPEERARRMLREIEKRFHGRALRQMPWERQVERDQQWAREMSAESNEGWIADALGRQPEWERYGFRGQVAKLLQQRGLNKKAIRFLSCNKCGRPGKCRRYPLEHKFYLPNGCEVVFCRECAAVQRRELFADYFEVICRTVLEWAGGYEEFQRLEAILRESDLRPGERPYGERKLRELQVRVSKRMRAESWVLARTTFTLRSDGSDITPDRVKKMNAAIRETMRKTVGSSRGYGVLFVDEVGFELRGHLPDARRVAHGLNLHAHGLYFGPRVDWERTRDIWMRETGKRFGEPSRGFDIRRIPVRNSDVFGAVRHALNHMLKYVSKPPAVTPERLASLIAAFETAKRVHSLGLFNGKKPEREKKECPCPKCRALGIVSTVSFEASAWFLTGGCIPRLLPIHALHEQGYELLSEASRASVLSMGAARENSWGMPP